MSWYEKTAETDAFDESVLSQTEKDNLKVIQEAEKTYADEHPYPKEYKTGQKLWKILMETAGKKKYVMM